MHTIHSTSYYHHQYYINTRIIILYNMSIEQFYDVLFFYYYYVNTYVMYVFLIWETEILLVAHKWITKDICIRT